MIGEIILVVIGILIALQVNNYNDTLKQQKILKYIETQTTKIQINITTIEKETTLVEEHKTTLIAEVVTAKIDVRNYELGMTNYE